MKSRFSLALVLPLLVIGCKDNGVQPDDDMVNFTGTVILESGQTYLIRSDIEYQKTVTTFYPLNLNAFYRQNGLRIRFSANVESDPLAQYIWPPIRLTSVEILIRRFPVAKRKRSKINHSTAAAYRRLSSSIICVTVLGSIPSLAENSRPK